MLDLLTQPEVIAALISLIVLELILGIDNLLFISVVTNKLPEEQRAKARNIGLGLALLFRLFLMSVAAWLMGLNDVVFDLGLQGGVNEHGHVKFETSFSWRDIIMIVGGLFLIWKATTELHEHIDPHPADTLFNVKTATLGFTTAILQILMIDAVFSLDSILTAIGMTKHLFVIYISVTIAMLTMMFAAAPMSRLVKSTPTLVTLALAFILMIGMGLVADGFGAHIPKGYLYVAMGFALSVESLNLMKRGHASPKAQS